MAVAHLPRWKTETINRLVVKIVHDRKLDLETFFNLSEAQWKADFDLTDKEVQDLAEAKTTLPNLSFLAEELLSQGFQVIPINAPAYSKTLKNNLKAKHAPTVLYTKGNEKILQEDSLAIVGSRDADDLSLQFTDNIAKKASEQYKVVVSGFAKGVDKQALDSALKYRGQSIIVLPQGILTFGSGIKKYYKELTEGDVIVLSSFPPKAGWSTGLAMARNPLIYGLADEIFVAQSADSGGTWAGVSDGLKKGRTVFVRVPNEGEKNANLLLIEKGATPVDFDGNIVTTPAAVAVKQEKKEDEMEQLITLLKTQPLTAKQLLEQVPIGLTPQQLAKKLKVIPEVQTVKKSGKVCYFIGKEGSGGTLF